jgi:hypothetical protein
MQKSAGCRSHLDRTLSAACQHDSHPPTRTSVRASLGSGSGVVPYNSRTTRRAPTGSHQRIRQCRAPVSKTLVIRENADERQRAPTGVGALITRRSQVQILPPPPITPGQRPFPTVSREGPRPVSSGSTTPAVGHRWPRMLARGSVVGRTIAHETGGVGRFSRATWAFAVPSSAIACVACSARGVIFGSQTPTLLHHC